MVREGAREWRGSGIKDSREKKVGIDDALQRSANDTETSQFKKGQKYESLRLRRYENQEPYSK
jgi:hypothetical protein